MVFTRVDLGPFSHGWSPPRLTSLCSGLTRRVDPTVRPTADIDQASGLSVSGQCGNLACLRLQMLRRELYDFGMLAERGVMTEVRINTARYCPYCASARALLRRKGNYLR
jgi:hypothetical protein